MDRTHHPAAGPIPAPAANDTSCNECGGTLNDRHVCPPEPPRAPIPSAPALAAMLRLETWAAHVLAARQHAETLRHELALGGAA